MRKLWLLLAVFLIASTALSAQSVNGVSGQSVNPTVLNSIPAQEYLNTSRPPLAYWDAALHNCRNQVVSINIYADSRSLQAGVGRGVRRQPERSCNLAGQYHNERDNQYVTQHKATV